MAKKKLTKKQIEARKEKALDESIQKWLKIINGTGKDLGQNNCPCCKFDSEVYKQDDYFCTACAIADFTGTFGCDGTPYASWIASKSSIHQNAVVDEKSLIAACEMLQFLISVKIALRKEKFKSKAK